MASRLLSFALRAPAGKSAAALPNRLLTTSVLRQGGHGPRKAQVQQAWTDVMWQNKRYYRWFWYFWGWTAFFGSINAVLGDSVYCDYDPELYSPDSHEVEIAGFTRFLHEHFYQPWESEMKAAAFDMIRTHNRLLMWQTCKDVWALRVGF